MPADPVFAAGARTKGVKIVEADVATTRKKLETSSFDGLFALDVLHLIQDPSARMSLPQTRTQAGLKRRFNNELKNLVWKSATVYSGPNLNRKAMMNESFHHH